MEKLTKLDCFKDSYKGKRVLITGHTGFKGAWLSLWLLKLGAKVGGFSIDLPTQSCLFNSLGLRYRVETFEGDISNLDDIKKAFEAFQPDVVFHLAAQPIIRRSLDEPLETFEVNILGTVAVLECIRVVPCTEAAVIVTSERCYENTGLLRGYVETDPLGGSDPYSASKGCAEIVTRSYFRSFFNKNGMPRIASARAGNVIGGGDWAQDRIIPDCVKAWQKGEDVIVRKPEITRPWQHVLEPLSGYLWLGASLLLSGKMNGEAFNFGPKENSIGTVGDLKELFLENLGDEKLNHNFSKKKKIESTFLPLNCDKSQEMLCWVPVLEFQETIEMTAQWYKQFYIDDKDIFSFSSAQIDEYVNKAKRKKIAWSV